MALEIFAEQENQINQDILSKDSDEAANFLTDFYKEMNYD
jgi:hypothetical protein